MVAPYKSSRAVLTQRSANALATGVCGGVRTTWMPAEAMVASKLAVNLVSRFRSRKRDRFPCSSSSARKLRATWATQGRSGLAVTPRTCTPHGKRASLGSVHPHMLRTTFIMAALEAGTRRRSLSSQVLWRSKSDPANTISATSIVLTASRKGDDVLSMPLRMLSTNSRCLARKPP